MIFSLHKSFQLLTLKLWGVANVPVMHLQFFPNHPDKIKLQK
jgi:hypothetical protein